ncbi:MAG: hypothetical protein BXU00_03055 [Candidatus Nanoclepta minutus]|uniref:Uncharacterized protein n=1 Tax=Candidatus Nanoclepta minutus TaxID=1940235 RepID=A0A397WMK7_9ARCH|nr:MAG: hypothetical protein BXU00_03055 [Candidatus Nanoclepta minutus]
MRGKRSIEQTIFLMFALIVFIIVAVVVLQMFLRGTSSVEKFGKQVSLEEAIRSCENYAVSNIIAYCTSIFTVDMNNDGRYSSVAYSRKGNLMVCESSLFCWSLVDNILGDRCMLELCRYYIYSAGLTPEEATLKTFGYYTKGGDSRYLDMDDTEQFKNTVLDFESYKSKREGEKGYIFIGPNCATDEIVNSVLRDIGRRIFPLLNHTYNSYSFGILYDGSKGYLYINKTYIRDDIQSSIASLYGKDIDRVPEAVPLCAILAFS